MSHARLGPSNARWPHCPGSIREEAQYPDTSGAAAIDGTGSHLLLEMCLENNCRADVYDGQIIGVNHPDNLGGWLVSIERIERVQMCLDYLTRRAGELSKEWPGSQISIEAESKSDPGGMFGRDDWNGTVDITITVSNAGVCQFIEIIDYKDGRGWVNEKNNTQLISYAGGKIRPYVASGPDLVRPFRPERVFGGVRMTIVQPKTNPVVRYQDMHTGTLIEKVVELSVAARKTDDPDAPLIHGKHCQWCKHNPKRGGHCTAETKQSLETVTSMSNDVITTDNTSLFELVNQVVADVKSLSSDQLSALADARSGLEAAFDKVDEEIQFRLEQEIPVAGYALKPGRGSNVWNAEEEVIAKALKGRRMKKDDIYPPKLISPAQLLKSDLLTDDQKKKIERDFITHKAGKLKVTKVGRGNEGNFVEKEVAQSATDVAQSSAELMFGDVAETAEPVEQNNTEVSFF